MMAITGALFAAIFLLAVALLLLLGEGTFNRQIRDLINRQSGNYIQGELRVGELKGKLFRELILEDVLLKESGDTLLYVKEALIRYDLVHLWRKQVLVPEMSIETVRINLAQDKDSVWNFMKIMPDPETDVVEEKSQSSFDWIVHADWILLQDLTVRIEPIDTSITLPRMMSANADLSMQWTPGAAFLDLQHFDMEIKEPDFSIEKVSILAELSDNKVTASDLKIKFTGGELYGNALIDLNEFLRSSVSIQIPELELQKLPGFLQIPPIQASPSITLKIQNQEAELTIEEGTQLFALKGWISGLDSMADYLANGSFRNIDLSAWTNRNDLVSDFSGNFRMKGQGTDILTNRMEIDFSLFRTRFMEQIVSTHLSMVKERDRLKGKVDLITDAGQLSSNLQANNIFQNAGVNAQMKLSRVDMSKILSDSIYQTSINADMSISASNVNVPDKMKVRFQLLSSENKWRDHSAGSIMVEGIYDRGDYSIDKGKIMTPWLELDLLGEGSLLGNHHLKYDLRIIDAPALARLAGIDSLAVTGMTAGILAGQANDLKWSQEMVLSDFWFNGVKFDSLDVSSDLSYNGESVTGTLYAVLENLQTDGITVRNINLQSVADGESIHNQLKINVDQDLRSDITFSVIPGPDLKVIIPHMKLIYKDISWLGYTDTLSYDRQRNDLKVPGITFESGTQSINISGHILDTLSVGIDIAIERLELGSLPLDSIVSTDISGMADGFFSLKGKPQYPQFSSSLLVSGFQLDTLMLDSIQIQAAYTENQLKSEASITGYNQRLLQVNGQIPLHLSLTDSVTLLKNDNSLLVFAHASIKDLSFFRSFLPSGLQIDGMTGLKLDVRNTIANPDFSGSVTFSEGKLSYPAYGVNYRNVILNGKFDQSHLLIDTVWIESGNGFLYMEGKVGLTGLDSLGIESIDLDLRANRFTVTNGPQAEMVVSSQFNLAGRPDAAKFNGNMRIERGLINLDALMAQFGMVTDDPNPPLLIDALESKQGLMGDTLTIKTEETIFNEVDFFKNLRGEFDIHIPGNTWVRGKDINMELTGNIKAIKEGVQTDLFGTLEVRRGHYMVYGKRLEVETGQIELTGGSQINPILNIEVAYSFRDREKQLRKLMLNVTGRALQPEIQFYLDGSRIEEKDGMAYLVFGRSMDELTQGEQSSVDYNMSDLGKSLALGQLSGLVQGALQSSLGLDVVDISGDDNWTTGNVTLGKYLTRNLFLSYSRNFAFDKKNKIAHPDEVILEYQIFKWLYLQAISQGANNGFDLIIQKKWK